MIFFFYFFFLSSLLVLLLMFAFHTPRFFLDRFLPLCAQHLSIVERNLFLSVVWSIHKHLLFVVDLMLMISIHVFKAHFHIAERERERETIIVCIVFELSSKLLKLNFNQLYFSVIPKLSVIFKSQNPTSNPIESNRFNIITVFDQLSPKFFDDSKSSVICLCTATCASIHQFKP